MTCGYGIDAIDATRTPRSSGFDAPSIRMISFSTSLFKAIALLKRKKIGSYKSHTIAIVNCAEVIAHECDFVSVDPGRPTPIASMARQNLAHSWYPAFAGISGNAAHLRRRDAPT
jgi:hypothetical protein